MLLKNRKSSDCCSSTEPEVLNMLATCHILNTIYNAIMLGLSGTVYTYVM